MNINGKTKITGLFGYPVEHTLSPAMHNAAFKELGFNYCYVPFFVHPDCLENAVRAIPRHEGTGRPLGSKSFVKKIEAMLGRCLSRRKPVPKTKNKEN